MVGDLLIIISLISIVIFYSIYREANSEQRKSLRRLIVLTAFATGFWIFDQQGSSSIALFISRYINRSIGHFVVPTGCFQAINPAIVLIFGTVMALAWKRFANIGLRPCSVSKLSIALLFLSMGFFLIAKAAAIANSFHLSSMLYPFLGLILIGAAEIFVDPVLLNSITSAAPKHSESRLVALYYLAVGSVANYLAAKVADFTIDPTKIQATAQTYHQVYRQISLISFIMFLLLALWAVTRNRKKLTTAALNFYC
jgi:POT family proton-dependent oligopeptide transporter